MKTVLINDPNAARRARSLEAAGRFGPAATRGLPELFAQWPGFKSTPLRPLTRLAGELGVGTLWAKDERTRLGLGSFKALGGAYAVLSLASEAASRSTGRRVSIADLLKGASKAPSGMTVAAATAGNHGRAVASGAALVGARCVIFVYDGVPEDQIAAIAQYGAEIVRISGVYETAVAECRTRATENGWTIVSDTSWEGYVDIPTRVMEGYTALGAEVVSQLPQRPTHLFLQAGVGGMAAALAAYSTLAYAPEMPAIVVVEPDAAPCLLASTAAGRPVEVPAGSRTTMGRLECYAPSMIAWNILDGISAAFISISDAQAAEAVRRLAREGIETSPSGAAGLGGVMHVMRDAEARAALRLGPDSRVLIIVTETPTLADRKALTEAQSISGV